MGTRTPYVSIYKPADNEVFDQQLNDNADYDLIDAAILNEHNLILAHTGAAAPHSGHAVLVGANLFQGSQQVVAPSDGLAVLVDTGALVAPGTLTGSRHTLRAHSYDTLDHRRDFILRARATNNAGAGIFEILTSLDGATPTLLWSLTNAGVLGANAAPNMELLFANTVLVTAASIDLTTLTNVTYVFPTAPNITITLPDARVTNRPITIYGPPTAGTQVTVAATAGAVVGGSANLTTGAVQNGIVVSGDSFPYKANGTDWKA
jgi:hypothetical protein